MTICEEDLLDDLKRVAEKLDKSPTVNEYRTHGDYTKRPIYRNFGSWQDALDAIDHSPHTAYGLPNEDLLNHMREKMVDTEITNIHEFMRSDLDYSKSPYFNKFGGYWNAAIRAGRKPPTSTPISESDYDSYIRTAIDADYPSVSLLGLLRAFTGIPQNALNNFSSDWISRLDSDLQPTLITVPSNHISSDERWELKSPVQYTVAGEKRQTGLEPLLRWVDSTDGSLLTTHKAKEGILSNLIEEAGLDVEPLALRATVAAHLARRGVSRFEIEMQVGFEKTNWARSVEDYFLYLYQFEDYCHPDYEPSGVYLDPDTGEPRHIDSDGSESD